MADEEFTFSTNIAGIVSDIASALTQLQSATAKAGKGPDLSKTNKFTKDLKAEIADLQKQINTLNETQIGRFKTAPKGTTSLTSSSRSPENLNYSSGVSKALNASFTKVEDFYKDLANHTPAAAVAARKAVGGLFESVAREISDVNTPRLIDRVRAASATTGVKIDNAKSQTGDYFGNQQLPLNNARTRSQGTRLLGPSGDIETQYRTSAVAGEGKRRKDLISREIEAASQAANATASRLNAPPPTPPGNNNKGGTGAGGGSGDGGSGKTRPGNSEADDEAKRIYQALVKAIERTAGKPENRTPGILGPEARQIGRSNLYEQQIPDAKGNFQSQFVQVKGETASIVKGELDLRNARRAAGEDRLREVRQLNPEVERLLANVKSGLQAAGKNAYRDINQPGKFFDRTSREELQPGTAPFAQANLATLSAQARRDGALAAEAAAGQTATGNRLRPLSGGVAFEQTGAGPRDGRYRDIKSGETLGENDTRRVSAEAALVKQLEAEGRAEQELAARTELLANVRAGLARRLGNSNTYADDSTGTRRYAELTPNGAKYTTQQNNPLRYDALAANDVKQQPRSVAGGFVAGLTSAGFGGGSGGGINLAGLAQAAGTTVKYSALYAVLNDVQQAAGQAVQELLNYEDSIANITLALGENQAPSQSFINNLADIASVSGANVGDAMDVAAQGMQAFGDETRQTNAEIQKIGETFAASASKLQIVTGTDLKTSSSQLRAILSGIAPAGQSGGSDTQQTQVLDAIAGAKAKFGGDSDDIAQGFQAISTSATQAGFSVNEIANIAATVTSKLGESGTLAGTRLSRLFSIIGGSEGQNAIRQLNEGLNPAQQVDVNANAATQVKQLSAAYATLSDKQREALGHSLGGTSQTRELFTILADGNDILETGGNEFDYYGKNAEEVRKRLANLRGELQQITGNLKNIIVAISQSGVLDPILAAFTAIVPVLNGVRAVFQTFNLIPRPIRDIAFALLEVYAALKLIQAVNARGGIKAALAGVGNNAVNTLAPGYALNRQKIKDQQPQRPVPGPRPLAPASLQNLSPANSAAALTANQRATSAFTQREAARAGLASNQATQVAARRVISSNPVGSAAALRGEAALTAARIRQAELLALSSAAEARYQAALAAQTAALKGKPLGPGGVPAPGTGGPLRANSSVGQSLKALGSSLRNGGSYLTNGNTLAQARAARLAGSPLVGAGPGTFNQIKGGVASGASASFGALSATLKQAQASAVAAGSAISRAALTSRTALVGALSSPLTSLKSLGTGLANAGKGILNFGRDLGSLSRAGVGVGQAFKDFRSGALVQSVSASMGKITSSIRAGLNSELGSALAIGIGIAAITQAYSKTQEQIKARNTLEDTISSTSAPSTADEARAQADTLSSQGQTARESAKGAIGGLANNFTAFLGAGLDLNVVAADADKLAGAQRTYADTLDKLNADAAVSSNGAESFDLSSTDGIAASLKGMQDSGRDAVSQLDAFNSAMTLLISNTRSGSISLTKTMQGTIAAGANVNLQTAILQGAEDDFNLGTFSGQKQGQAARTVDTTAVGNIAQQTFTDAQAQGINVGDKKGQDAVRKLLHDRLDDTLKAAGLDDDHIDAYINQIVVQASTQQRKLTTFDGTAAGLAQLASANSDLVAPSSAQKGLAATLSGAEGGGSLAEARANLVGQQDVLESAQQKANADVAKLPADQQAAKAEEYANALEQQRVKVQQAQVALNSAQSDTYAAMGALAASLVPSTDTVGQTDAQLATLDKQLSVTTDANAKAGIEAQQNQLRQQRAAAVIAASNAKDASAVDPRDATGQATQAFQASTAVLKGITDSGDTTSQAYFDAVKANNAALIESIKANVAHTDAIAKASLRVGDGVAEAALAYTTAVATAKASFVAGSPELAAALREIEGNQGLASRQAVTQRSTAARDASIDPRDSVRQNQSDLQDLIAQRNDLNAGDDTGRDKLTREIAEKRQSIAESQLARDNAGREASVESYDTLGQARVATVNALATLNGTLPGTQAYYEAQIALRRAQFDQAQADQKYNQTLAKLALDPRDTLGLAKLAAQQARQDASKFKPGTQERADADIAVKQADLAAQQEQLATDQARRSAAVFPGDYLGGAQADLGNAKEALDQALVGTKEYYNAQKAYNEAAQALVKAQEQAASEAAKLNIDLTNPVQTAAQDLVDARKALADAQAAGAPASTTDKLKNDVRNAEAAQDSAAFNQRLSDAQTADNLGRISHAAYLQYLQAEHDRLTTQLAGMSTTANGYRQAVDQLNQIDGLIKDAKESLNQQFNLNDVTLPTLYEVRRAVGASADSIRSQVVDYSSTQAPAGTVIINGADMNAVIGYINKTLGTGSKAMYTTSPRRV